ncbi:putative calcium transporter [Peziza echinospora]|nr:putative calcium transporter [Peziza echinospora]
MVLVYLKNLLFPPPSRPRSGGIHGLHSDRGRSTNGHTHTTTGSTPPKYGSFSSSASSSPHHLHVDDIEASAPLLLNTSVDDLDRKPKKTKFFSPRVISDAIIGLSDGLTVPFALTAGLSTFNDTRVVVYGGLAELIAGSISMGLGGWLAARGEMEYYESTVTRTLALIDDYQTQQRKLQIKIFTPYHLPPPVLSQLLSHLLSPTYPSSHLLSLLLHFHHNLSPPDPHRATISALTISMGYFFGGFVPLVPYFFVGRQEVMRGLVWSVGVMGVCLFGFGGWKTGMMDSWFGEGRWRKVVKGGFEMVIVGGLAAGGAMGIVRLLGNSGA